MSYTREQIEQKAKEIIADKLCIKTDEIKGETSVYHDLGADSLDGIEIVMAFEDEFDITILDNECSDWGNLTFDKIVGRLDEIITKQEK